MPFLSFQGAQKAFALKDIYCAIISFHFSFPKPVADQAYPIKDIILILSSYFYIKFFHIAIWW